MKKIIIASLLFSFLFVGVANAQTAQEENGNVQTLYFTLLKQYIALLVQEVNQLEQRLSVVEAQQAAIASSTVQEPLASVGVIDTATSTQSVSSSQQNYTPSPTLQQIQTIAPSIVQTAPAPVIASANPDITTPQSSGNSGSITWCADDASQMPIVINTYSPQAGSPGDTIAVTGESYSQGHVFFYDASGNIAGTASYVTTQCVPSQRSIVGVGSMVAGNFTFIVPSLASGTYGIDLEATPSVMNGKEVTGHQRTSLMFTIQ